MSFSKEARIGPSDRRFYDRVLKVREFAKMTGGLKMDIEPNNREVMYDVTFDDGFTVRLNLVSNDECYSLDVEFFQDNDPIDKDIVLEHSYEDEQSIWDQNLVGFFYNDEWHFIVHRQGGDK